ncbi:MAG TPA: tetratricopeptide repeat protein, partial [Catalimonadaceae bacterium]|nr:tetratricopeptide repeat protein [Catalimonadaceae bacterium]
GEYGKSERFLNQAVDIQIITLGKQHPEVADNHFNLSVLHWKKGNYSKAESHQLEALAIRKRKLGEYHPDVASSYHLLGLIYLSNHQLQKAGESFKVWKTRKYLLVQRYLPSLSDNEKEKFYDSNISRYQEDFKSFCVEQYPLKKEISIDLFNDQLAMKGLLLNSSAKWKHRIKTSGDKKLFSLFSEWEANQNKLSKLLQSTDSTERTRLDSVLAQTEKMEEELSLRSENFAKLADKKLVTWKDIQKTLKPGEAAIEMVRIKKFGIRKTVTDTSDANKRKYKIKGLTDTIYYAALIVKPESMYPEMVLLKNGNDLEGRHLKYYQNLISRQLPDNQSYSTFWEKIGAKLGTSNRVYFSPDGVFHNINLNTLFNPKTKKYLLDEKDIRLVTVTKDLVTPGRYRF